MNKIILSFMSLISVSFADYIPYKELVSDKYSYIKGAGFYTGSNDVIPKQVMRFYKNSYDEGTKYVKLSISEELYDELSQYEDYKSHLEKESSVRLSDNKMEVNAFLFILPSVISKDIIEKDYWFEVKIEKLVDFTCSPTGINFTFLNGAETCRANKLSDMFKKK